MIPWIARPDQTEPLLRAWADRYPDLAGLDTVRLWSHHACALTVGRLPHDSKRKCLFTVPHAHEPAGTAACMNVLSELLDGCRPDGSPARLDRDAILERTLLTFIPDGNPEGRSRSPEDAWDGARYTNEEFLKVAFGQAAQTGERFRRVDRWRTTEQAVEKVGIVYERVNETTYVEPNRDWGSSFFRLVHMLIERHRYDRFLDLHQTEFESSRNNCEVLLPVIWNELTETIRSTSQSWADAITADWKAIAGAQASAPYPLGYTGQQRAYFEQNWGDIYRSVPCVTVEIQNNNLRTPPDLQRELAESAIRTTLSFARDIDVGDVLSPG